MNERRKRAHAILVRTRDILAERLTDRVLEDEQDILDDASGADYMDDISRLYESVGNKLGQVNLMIANLPVEKEPVQKSQTFKPPMAAGANSDAPKTFAMFGQQVASNQIESAAETLSELLAIGPEQALRSASHFGQKLRTDPQTIQKTMQLRAEIYAGNTNKCIMILSECFDVDGPEALQVVQHLLSQVA